MTKAEQRKIFIDLRDFCSRPIFEKIGDETFSKRDEYRRIYEGLEKTDNFDVNYADNLKGKDGYEMASNAEKLTFKECCTVLTFLLRAEQFAEGAFTEALSNGNVHKLLARAVEVM